MGISVGFDAVQAVLVRRRAIAWAGRANYNGEEDLAEVIARLAGEGNGVARPSRVRVVLEREMVQLRTLVPPPPLRSSAMRRWVALEAPRLFRKNGAPLVTDGRLVRLDPGPSALWAAAASAPVLEAVLIGCAGAGLAVSAIGVAAEVLPHAVVRPAGSILIANGRTAESVELAQGVPWRSRLQRKAEDYHEAVAWVAPLAALDTAAPHFASAFAAAVAEPRLVLLPAAARLERERYSRRHLLRLGALGLVVWLAALAVYLVRLSSSLHSATSFLEASRASVDSVVSARRDLATARAALASVRAADAGRSRHGALLASVAAALPDSAYLVSWQVTSGDVVRLAGYAPIAARVLAALERVVNLHEARFEGPVSREAIPNLGERDRFAVIVRFRSWQ